MLSRVAIQAARNTASGQLATLPGSAGLSFRSSLIPAKRCFASYSWQRVSSTKPWDKPLRDTVPKAEKAKAAVFSLSSLPQNVVGFAALLGCMVFMTPQGVVTGFNMMSGVKGTKNDVDENGNTLNQFQRRPTNVCKETGGSAAGNSAGRRFNPNAMHPYMNGLTVGHENQFSRKNSKNF